MQENSSSLRGLRSITTCSAVVDGTSSSTLKKELVICGAINEECLRSGLQKCLTLLHFIAAAEGLSFFSSFFLSTFPGLVELGKHYGVREFFSPKHTKKKLLHKSHQLLRNSIFVSQKLLCKNVTVNSSLVSVSNGGVAQNDAS